MKIPNSRSQMIADLKLIKCDLLADLELVDHMLGFHGDEPKPADFRQHERNVSMIKAQTIAMIMSSADTARRYKAHMDAFAKSGGLEAIKSHPDYLAKMSGVGNA